MKNQITPVKLLCAVISLFFSANAFSQTIYVDVSATGSDNGSSWTNAHEDLQPALDTASAGDTIWVAKGTYLPTESPDGTTTDVRDRAFHLNTNIVFWGGYPTGGGTRNAASNTTILSGDLGGTNTDSCYHVLITANLTSAAEIDGFTIQAGRADGTISTISYASLSFERYAGGGMFNSSSSPKVTNVTFSSNTANYGGGMTNITSSPTLTNLMFSSNTAAYDGGGMLNSPSSPTLANVTFSSNIAYDGSVMYNFFF